MRRLQIQVLVEGQLQRCWFECAFYQSVCSIPFGWATFDRRAVRIGACSRLSVPGFEIPVFAPYAFAPFVVCSILKKMPFLVKTAVMGVEQLCNVAGRAFGEMEQTKMTYPDWLSTLLKSFSVLGRNFSSKEAVLLDWSKGPGMAILVHSAVASDLTGTAVGVEGLRARAKKKGADVSDGGQDADGDGPDKDGDRDGAGGRMEWRRELELDMVGGIEERAGGLHLEAGEAKRTASRKSFFLGKCSAHKISAGIGLACCNLMILRFC